MLSDEGQGWIAHATSVGIFCREVNEVVRRCPLLPANPLKCGADTLLLVDQ